MNHPAKRKFYSPCGPILALLVVLVCGCAANLATQPTLNSERILNRFGSYGVEVLEQSNELRVANLYSGKESEEKICRTFAVTRFQLPIKTSLAAVHQSIIAGASIGSTMKQAGWDLEKRRLFVGLIEPAAQPKRLNELMKASSPHFAVYVYELSVNRAGRSILYATIAELYHPDYLDLPGLEQIAGSAGPKNNRIPQVMHDAILASIQ